MRSDANELPWSTVGRTLVIGGVVIGVLDVAGVRLSRLRHRPDRQRCLLSRRQEHPHRDRHGLVDDRGHAAVRARARHRRRLPARLGRRCDPVFLHRAVVDPRGAADRGLRADDPGVHRQERRKLFETGIERSDLKLLFLCLVIGLDRVRDDVPPRARRDAEAARARLRAGVAGVRRRVRPRSWRGTSCPT